LATAHPAPEKVQTVLASALQREPEHRRLAHRDSERTVPHATANGRNAALAAEKAVLSASRKGIVVQIVLQVRAALQVVPQAVQQHVQVDRHVPVASAVHRVAMASRARHSVAVSRVRKGIVPSSGPMRPRAIAHPGADRQAASENLALEDPAVAIAHRAHSRRVPGQ
jgi:hypothetical protein